MMISTCMSVSALTSTIHKPTHINTNSVSIDKRRLEKLLEIEKHYVDIVALGVKKQIEEKKQTPTETVLRCP